MTLDLRPLTLAELLDRSFSTYKRHLWLFVGIMAVPAALAMVTAILLRLFNSGLNPATPPAQMLLKMVPLFIGSFIFGISYLLVYMFALGATTVAVSQIYLGHETTVGACYQAVRRHGGQLVALMIVAWLRLFGTWFGLTVLSGILAALFAVLLPLFPLVSVVVFTLGFIASSVLAFYLAVRYAVAVPAIVLEGIPATASLRRSVYLTEGNRGRVFLMMLCAIMIAYATAAICQGPFALGGLLAGPFTTIALVLGLVGAVVGAIGGMFSGPIMIIGLAMMYYDLRIRKEALDLHMLLENLDAPVRS
jgi:hypothetical protein